MWTCEKWTNHPSNSGLNGQCKEECDLGAFNAPKNYDDISVSGDPNYAREYACSKDCRLIEKKFEAVDKVTKYKYSTKSKLPQKWNCVIVDDPKDRNAPADPTKKGYE